MGPVSNNREECGRNNGGSEDRSASEPQHLLRPTHGHKDTSVPPAQRGPGTLGLPVSMWDDPECREREAERHKEGEEGGERKPDAWRGDVEILSRQRIAFYHFVNAVSFLIATAFSFLTPVLSYISFSFSPVLV